MVLTAVIQLFRQRLDLIALAGCAAIGIGILGLSLATGVGQHGMGFAFLLACATYLGLRRRLPAPSSSPRIGLDWVLFGTIVFLSTLLIAIYAGLAEPYNRPELHFVLITMAYATVLIDVAAASSRLAVFIGLCKILLASIAFRAIRFLSFATIPGIDIYAHMRFAGQIAEIGQIPAYEAIATKYVATPVWHVLVAVMEVVFGLSNEYAVFIGIVTVFAVATIVFMYAIVRQITGEAQPALLAALFVATADMFLVRGMTSITPSSLVVIYTFIVLLLALISLQRLQHLAVFFTLVAAFLTHQLSAFALIVILLIIVVVSYLYRLGSISTHGRSSLYATHVLFAGTALALIWLQIPTGGMNFFDQMIQRLVQTLMGLTGPSDSEGAAYASTFASHGFVSNLLYSLGYDLLLFISVVGALIWVHPTNQSFTRVTYPIAALSLFTLIYPMTYLGLDQLLIPHRLIVFLELFLVIFAGVAVWVIYRTTEARAIHIALAAVICLLIFSMITTPFVNRDNPVYGEDRVERNELTHAEVEGLLWATEHSDHVYTDQRVYRSVLDDQTDDDVGQSSEMDNYPPDLAFENNSVTAIRTDTIDQTLVYTGTFGGGAQEVSGQDVQDEMRENHRVYDNGDVVNYAG